MSPTRNSTNEVSVRTPLYSSFQTCRVEFECQNAVGRHLRGCIASAANPYRAKVVGLLLLIALVVRDQLVILVEIGGDLRRPHRHDRVLDIIDKGRVALDRSQLPVRAVPPQTILDHVAADVRTHIAKQTQAIDIPHIECVAPSHPLSNLFVINVVLSSQRFVLEVESLRCLGLIFRRTCRSTGSEYQAERHLGSVAYGVDCNLGKRAP